MDWLQPRRRVVSVYSMCSPWGRRIFFAFLFLFPPLVGASTVIHDAGQVSFFMESTCPSGWEQATGQVIYYAPPGGGLTDSKYRDVWVEMGNSTATWPSPWITAGGFNAYDIPDLQGKFLRSSPGFQTTYDYPRTFGSLESDAFQGHFHYQNTEQAGHVYQAEAGSSGLPVTNGGYNEVSGLGTYARLASSEALTDTLHGVPRIASETRPVNVSLTACVKLSNTLIPDSGGGSMVSTFTLVAVSTTAATALTPGIFKNFTGGDLSFWFGVIMGLATIWGFKAGGMR